MQQNMSQSCDFIINELQDFFLLKSNMDKSLTLQINNPYIGLNNSLNEYNTNCANKNDHFDKNIVNENTNVTNVTNVNDCVTDSIITTAPSPYTPDHKDSLFWCFYIIKYGFDEFNMIDNKHFIIEKNEKIAAIELLREKKDILKQYKIKSLSDIESDLTNSSCISIKTFFALAIIYGFNVMYIKNNAYYEFLSDDNLNAKIHAVKATLKKYSYECIQSQDTVNNYRAKYYKMVSIDKSINAISTYKNSELLELSKKLCIDLHEMNSIKKITKKELYDAINAYFL